MKKEDRTINKLRGHRQQLMRHVETHEADEEQCGRYQTQGQHEGLKKRTTLNKTNATKKTDPQKTKKDISMKTHKNVAALEFCSEFGFFMLLMSPVPVACELQ